MKDVPQITSGLPNHAPASASHIETVDSWPCWYRDDSDRRACLDRDGYTDIWGVTDTHLVRVEFLDWEWTPTTKVPTWTDEAVSVVEGTLEQLYHREGELPEWVE